jgi:hypothetical protein
MARLTPLLHLSLPLSHTPFILRLFLLSLFFRPSGEFLDSYSCSVLMRHLTVHASAFVRYCETVHQRRPLHYLLLGSQSFFTFKAFFDHHFKHLPIFAS